MIGLCRVCLTSGVPLFITKRKIHCDNCKDRNVRPQKEKEKKEEKILDFETLPQATLEQRLKHIYQVVDESYELEFIKRMKDERIAEPLIDGPDES